MATSTTNYGLVKPAYNETADVAVINSNMDTIDTQMAAAVHKTGAETIGGEKRFTDDPKIGGSSRYKRIHFTQSGGNNCGSIYFDTGHATNQSSNRMGFTEMSPKATPDSGNTGYGETYYLPAPDSGMSENVNYNIWTRKEEPILYQSSATAHSFNVPNNTRWLLIHTGDGVTRTWIGFIYCASNGAITVAEIYKGDNVSESHTTNTITFTMGSASSCYMRCIKCRADTAVISNAT